MQNNKICILIAGIENLRGNHAIEMVKYFDLEHYPNQKVGTHYYYSLFNNNLNPRDGERTPKGLFSEFLVFLTLRGYGVRFDRAHVYSDTAVDYVLKIGLQRESPISMPKHLGRV